jgi:phosphatidate cytidylyltransferase
MLACVVFGVATVSSGLGPLALHAATLQLEEAVASQPSSAAPIEERPPAPKIEPAAAQLSSEGRRTTQPASAESAAMAGVAAPQPLTPDPNASASTVAAQTPNDSQVAAGPPSELAAASTAATDEGAAVLTSGADAVDQSVSNAQVAAPALDPEWLDTQTKVLLGVVLVTLGIASLVGQYLRRQPTESVNPALVQRFRQRLNSWWLMCAILVFGLLLQPIGTIVLFALVSFWALREFITMAPTRRGDHRALFWALIVITPLQYLLIGVEHVGLHWRNGKPIDLYGLYSIMIPVYASLLVPARIALSGDHKRFLERSAQITIGLLICVYSLSYAAALVNLRLISSEGLPWTGSPAGLLFFFILISQLSDILQWSWGHLVGHRVIAAEVSSSRTWEGFTGGTLSTGLIGAALYWVTPFSFWEAACMSMVIGVMGMFGGMTMSAIKRDRGVNDYGSLVMGHAGVLDRIDTLCFAAPVFYHLTRFFFTQ